MFNKKWQYGNLKFIKNDNEEKWLFIEESSSKEFEPQNFLSVLNKLGDKGWELVSINEDVGFILKKKR